MPIFKKIRKNRIFRKKVHKKAPVQHVVRIPRILKNMNIPDRKRMIFRSDFLSFIDAKSNLLSNIQIDMNSGYCRPVTGESGSFGAGVAPAGLFHWFGSNVPVGATIVGQNTGMYSAMRVWESRIKVTFIPLVPTLLSVNASYIFYCYPTANNNTIGSPGAITFQNITEQKGVKFYMLNTQNTANPRTISLQARPYQILGVDESAYTASQYDSTLVGGTLGLPSLTALSCFWTYGVCAVSSTGTPLNITGDIMVQVLQDIELFSRNESSQLAST